MHKGLKLVLSEPFFTPPPKFRSLFAHRDVKNFPLLRLPSNFARFLLAMKLFFHILRPCRDRKVFHGENYFACEMNSLPALWWPRLNDIAVQLRGAAKSLIFVLFTTLNFFLLVSVSATLETRK